MLQITAGPILLHSTNMPNVKQRMCNTKVNLHYFRNIGFTPTILTTDRQDTDVVMHARIESLRSVRENMPSKPHSHIGLNTNGHVETGCYQ